MNNEEKILAMLEKLTSTVEQHGETLSELQKTVTRVALTQENIVLKSLDALSEGHTLLLEKLARKERVEALEDDVALLKTVIKAVSQRVEALEKAQ